MIEHYPVQGDVQELSDEDAQKLMDEISQQWEDEKTPFGKLYTGVHDWDFTSTGTVIKVNIPKLRTGGEMPLNTTAKAKFGFDIYGDCFLKK